MIIIRNPHWLEQTQATWGTMKYKQLPIIFQLMNSPKIRRILRILPRDFLIFGITVVGFFIIERLLNLVLFSDAATLKNANTLAYDIAILAFQIATYLGWINTVFLFLPCLTINKTLPIGRIKYALN